MTIYAIGDIHGQLGMLDAALDRLARDGADLGPQGKDELIFLGDLVDRGPQSREVLERIITNMAAGQRWTAIRGNHDEMFRVFLESGQIAHKEVKSGLLWLERRLGGTQTLRSYGIEVDEDSDPATVREAAVQQVPAAHRAFLDAMPLWQERDGLLFVHAGIRPGVALQDQTVSDLTWIRDPFYAVTDPFPWLIVHGHTVMPAPTHFGNRIDIDTGAGANPSPKYLTLAAFEGRDCFIVTEDGRVPLPAPAKV